LTDADGGDRRFSDIRALSLIAGFMLSSSKLIYPALQLTRSLPFNTAKEDEPYFLRQLTDTSREVNILYYRNVTVNNELFIKHGIRFSIDPNSFGDFWQDKVYNKPTYLAKSFIKDRLRKKVKIDAALWCFDLFSTGGYFHWLTEICPRLWIAQQHVDPEIPLLVPEYFLQKWKFGRDFLAAFNRKIITYGEHELPVIKHMTFVQRPGGPFNYQPVSIAGSTRQIQERYFDKQYSNQQTERIYISRKKSGKRMVLNEDEVAALAKRYGYTVLILEDLSIADQVNIFSRATSVLSIHGAGLTNMVYMKPGGTVIEIRHHEDNHMLNCFFTLANTFGLRYGYCFGYNKGDSLPTENRPEDKSIHADMVMLEGVLKQLHAV
jgi:hypothetical protein